jgi:hypothetical protein
MLDALARLSDETTVARVRFKPDETISRIVTSWPGALDNTRALHLGFVADTTFDNFISQHIAENKPIS